MIIFFCFALIVYLLIRNYDLKSEIKILKKEKTKQIEKQKKINFCPKCGFNLQELSLNNSKNSIIKEKIEKQNIKPTREILNLKKTINETELKNSAILSVGAILIIISAIVFLATTWNTSIGIIKTLIITLMFFVFLGSSYIADKYLNIKNTSKVFLYLAFSYLPLVFLSVSLFELLGYNLSFYGPGKYVYLAISSILLTIIYYNIMRKKKDIFFAIGGYLFQIISIILLVLIFTTNINWILLCISIYILLFHAFYSKKKFYYNQNVHKIINQIMTLSIIIIPIYFTTIIDTIKVIEIPFLMLIIVNYFNMYYLLEKEDNSIIEFKYIDTLYIMLIMFMVARMINKGFIIYQLAILIGIVIAYGKDILTDNTIRNESYIETSICLLVTYLNTFSQENVIPTYFLILIYLIMTIYQKKISKDNNTTFNFIIPIIINISIIDFIFTMELNKIVLPIIYIIIYIGSKMIREKDLSESMSILSIPFTGIGFIIATFEFYDYYLILGIIAILISIVYLLISLEKEKSFINYLSYCWIIVSIFFLRNIIGYNEESVLYIFPIGSIITFLLEKLCNQSENKNYLFLFIEFVISFIGLVFTKTLFGFLLLIMNIILYIIYNKEWKKPNQLNYLPLSSIHTFLYLNTYTQLFYNTTLILSFSLALIQMVYLCYSKKKEYIGMSLFSILFTIIFYSMSSYSIVISLIISMAAYLYVDRERSKIYKSILYILITILLKLIINDFNFNTITVLNIGIWIAPLILITRTILKDSYSNYKILEYVGLIIINYIAIAQYGNETDGMIFVGLLLILTIIGYLKKIGPVFLVSLIFILINVFILTREFWLTLPWWIYILLVGCILILFAIRNELREKNQKTNILKEVAKGIDL